MKEVGLQQVPVAAIDTTARLRQVDGLMAAALAENIQEIGRLRQPIEVRVSGGSYALIAGAHRLAAVKRLGWKTIPAFVFEASDDEARLAEIDENLVRHELNPLDRASFLAARQEVWERLYPDTKHGVAGGKARQGAATDTMSFAADTAQRLGITSRTVRRAVSIHRGLAADVRAQIVGTALAQSQTELLALAKLPPEDQRQVVPLLLAEAPQVRTVQAAMRMVSGAPLSAANTDDRGFERLVSAWGRASPAAAKRLWHIGATHGNCGQA